MTSTTTTWKRATIPIESGTVPPKSVSAAVLLRVPLPASLLDARGTPFLAQPFAFESAKSSIADVHVVAVSVGGSWVPTVGGTGEAHALELGEALIVWVENDTDSAHKLSVEVTGLVPDDDKPTERLSN